MLLSFSFFFGLVLSLLAVGIAASYLGRLVSGWSTAFGIVAAVFSFIAGSAILGAPVLRRYLPNPDIAQRSGIAGAFIYGLLFTVATIATSAGPLLLLLTIAAAIGNPVYGAGLSFAYALGRGVPFLLLGLFAGSMGAWLARFARAQRTVEVLSGLALFGVAIYFVVVTISPHSHFTFAP